MKPIFLRDLKPWDWSKVNVPDKYQLKKFALLIAMSILVHNLLTDQLPNYETHQYSMLISLVTGYVVSNLLPVNLVEHSFWLAIPYILLNINLDNISIGHESSKK